MKIIAGAIIIFLLLSSCARKNAVIVSGRVENGDTIVSVWVDDTIYSFPLDENGFLQVRYRCKKAFMPLSYRILSICI